MNSYYVELGFYYLCCCHTEAVILKRSLPLGPVDNSVIRVNKRFPNLIQKEALKALLDKNVDICLEYFLFLAMILL